MTDKDRIFRELAGRLGARATFDEPMAAHTTFRVGGPAELFCSPASVDEVRACVEAAREAHAPWHVIGQGSNLLVADSGLAGIVIHLGDGFSHIDVDGTLVTAQAGATNRAVALAARDAGLAGYEFASGIPGSIGGAAFMNAGAYDGQFADVARAVTCLDAAGEVVRLSAADAAWAYRSSAMQTSGQVVLSAELELAPGSPDAIAARIEDLDGRRAAKQPLDLGSAGSTFKRPAGHFAAKLIDDAGLRGHRVGGAMVSTKHTGFVVNAGDATAADVLQVIRDVQQAVWEREGVRLEPEVRLWGFGSDEEARTGA